MLLCVAIGALAASRDGYRSAYRVWRELDPALERDVATAGPGVAARTTKMAAAAARYGSERGGFLKAIAAEGEQGVMTALTTPAAPAMAEIPNSGSNRVTAQTAAVQRTIASFASVILIRCLSSVSSSNGRLTYGRLWSLAPLTSSSALANTAAKRRRIMGSFRPLFRHHTTAAERHTPF